MPLSTINFNNHIKSFVFPEPLFDSIAPLKFTVRGEVSVPPVVEIGFGLLRDVGAVVWIEDTILVNFLRDCLIRGNFSINV